MYVALTLCTLVCEMLMFLIISYVLQRHVPGKGEEFSCPTEAYLMSWPELVNGVIASSHLETALVKISSRTVFNYSSLNLYIMT